MVLLPCLPGAVLPVVDAILDDDTPSRDGSVSALLSARLDRKTREVLISAAVRSMDDIVAMYINDVVTWSSTGSLAPASARSVLAIVQASSHPSTPLVRAMCTLLHRNVYSDRHQAWRARALFNSSSPSDNVAASNIHRALATTMLASAGAASSSESRCVAPVASACR